MDISLNWRALRGFEGTVTRLQDLRQSNRLPPVLLLEGHAGIGKTQLAAQVSALYMCETASACGNCGPCRDVSNGRHADVYWLRTDEERIKIESASELQDHLQYNPGESKNEFAAVRIAVVIDIDKLVPQAANRLLKILEEPPPRARIIMTTSRYQNLLDTIKSRCVKWHVRLPTDMAGDPREDLDASLAEQMINLFGTENDCDAIIAAQEMQKKYSLSPVELVRTAELVLNQHYRFFLTNQDHSPPGIMRIQRRRQQLRELRKLAGRKQIAINPQLSVESLVMFE